MGHVNDHDNDIETLLKQLIERTIRIEKKLNEVSKSSQTNHISIEHVDIHQPILKELSFRLDALDIKELSGSLNIGNNFGSRVGSSKEKKTEYKTQGKQERFIIININNKRIPYRIELVEKEKRGEG